MTIIMHLFQPLVPAGTEKPFLKDLDLVDLFHVMHYYSPCIRRFPD